MYSPLLVYYEAECFSQPHNTSIRVKVLNVNTLVKQLFTLLLF